MALPSCNFTQSQHFMGWTNQPQGSGTLFATSNQLHAINMTPVNYHQKRLQEDITMLQQQQKRRLQTQTPTKPWRQQNLRQLIHSVSWHTSFMLLAIMYMWFGHLGHQMGLSHKQYVTFSVFMQLDTYQHQPGRVGTLPTQMVLSTCPQRPVHMQNHKTATLWVDTILVMQACTTAKLPDREKVSIWCNACQWLRRGQDICLVWRCQVT